MDLRKLLTDFSFFCKNSLWLLHFVEIDSIKDFSNAHIYASASYFSLKSLFKNQWENFCLKNFFRIKI